eukprot:581817-Prymnesium_polylepis.1
MHRGAGRAHPHPPACTPQPECPTPTRTPQSYQYHRPGKQASGHSSRAQRQRSAVHRTPPRQPASPPHTALSHGGDRGFLRGGSLSQFKGLEGRSLSQL